MLIISYSNIENEDGIVSNIILFVEIDEANRSGKHNSKHVNICEYSEDKIGS